MSGPFLSLSSFPEGSQGLKSQVGTWSQVAKAQEMRQPRFFGASLGFGGAGWCLRAQRPCKRHVGANRSEGKRGCADAGRFH